MSKHSVAESRLWNYNGAIEVRWLSLRLTLNYDPESFWRWKCKLFHGPETMTWRRRREGRGEGSGNRRWKSGLGKAICRNGCGWDRMSGVWESRWRRWRRSGWATGIPSPPLLQLRSIQINTEGLLLPWRGLSGFLRRQKRPQKTPFSSTSSPSPILPSISSSPPPWTWHRQNTAEYTAVETVSVYALCVCHNKRNVQIYPLESIVAVINTKYI